MRILPLFFVLFSASMIFVFASMSTFTLFSGSHRISDISSDENDIPCTSCHSKIASELSNSSIHSSFTCEECHRLVRTSDGKLIKYAVHNVSGVYPGNQSHAAYTPRCLDCHGGNGIYYNDTWVAKQAPPAKAFNESDYGSGYSAHKSFVEYSTQVGLSVGENEACIACHTNYSMKFDYRYFWNISYSMSGWVINSFSYNGTRNYIVNYQKTGAKHEFLNKTEVDCTKCHENIYYALVYGTSNPDNEDYLTHAPIEIDRGTNAWGTDNDCWVHYRYHYISPAYRADDVSTEYCIECHNIAWYSEEFPNLAVYYGLSDVVGDTNSSYVHAAEIVTCATCHGKEKTKWVHCADHEAANFVNYVDSNYPRNVNGDICMGCHEAAVHPDSGSTCGNCHGLGGIVDYAYVYSEPSGYVINSNSEEPTPPPQQCVETWERTTDDGVTINFSLGFDNFVWTFEKSGTSSESVELYFDNNTADGIFYGVESNSYWCSATPADCYCIMTSPADYSDCHPNPSEIGVTVVKEAGYVQFIMSNSLNSTGTVKMLGSTAFGWYDYTEMDEDPLPVGEYAIPNGTVYVGSCYLPDENGW